MGQNSLTCFGRKKFNNDLLRTELLNCLEWDLGPEDILQKDILPNLPPTGGYDPIITPINVFFTLFVCLSGSQYHCNVSGGPSNNGRLIQNSQNTPSLRAQSGKCSIFQESRKVVV